MDTKLVLLSQKGGVGKTTVALNLSVALAERGHETLLVDLDPQGGMGLSLCKTDTEWVGLGELLLDKIPVQEAVRRTRLENLSLLPRGRVDAIDLERFEWVLRRKDLRKLLEPIKAKFRYVIMDTPSGLGPATRAGLAASDFAMVLMQGEPLALRSIPQVLRVLEHVAEKENPQLRLLGILPTLVDLARDPALRTMGTLWSGFAGVMDTVIPRAAVYTEASYVGRPLSHLGGRPHPEARRFDMLATEVEALVERLSGVAQSTEHAPRDLV